MSKDPEYDLKAMRDAVKRCDENIKVFEAAIDKELETKRHYQHIVRNLEEKLEERD